MRRPDKFIPGRTWTTETAVARKGDIASFGIRLVVATSEVAPQYVPSVPGIVRQLVDTIGLSRNGRKLRSDPILVDDTASLDGLVDLLLDPRRKNPVFVASLDENEVSGANTVIDVGGLAARTIGIAHVALITGEQAFALTDMLGRSLSVFRRAVRTYRPAMTLDDDPYRHPLAIPQQIISWGGQGPESFVNMLIETAARNSVRATDPEADLPTFTKAKQVALHQQRNATTAFQDYPALLALAEDELSEKQREITDLESLLVEEETRRQAAEERRDELESTNQFLRHRVVELETAEASELPTRSSTELPSELAGVGEWAEKALSGRVRITGRAQRDAKVGRFADVTLVYECLSYLGREFWTLKTVGGKAALDANDKRLQELGIHNEPSGAEHLLKEQGDTFLVQWGPNGRKRLLNMHLKNGGNTRDPSRCLRIYYFWDDDSQQVVVGSLPGHLDTRAT